MCVILGEHRSVARTFTVKLCPDVSGLSCAMVVNTGWRFAGGCAIFYAERRLRLSLYRLGKDPRRRNLIAPVPLNGDLGPPTRILRAPKWAQCCCCLYIQSFNPARYHGE